MTNVTFTHYDSPVGRLTLEGDGEALTRIRFPGEDRTADSAARPELFAEAITQLDAYFAGDLRSFDLPLAPRGTDFQRKVWDLLRGIPYGTTISYGELARRAGNPNACRAVGAANGKNPLPIVIPCHRVIGRDGRMTGFGGGIEVKRYLLRLEGVALA
jgi:methylated-DNA-[protein]-cysteine S-methyltransferase